MLSKYSEYLENAFDVLNRIYFNGTLPKVIITIMSTPHAYGHMSVGEVWMGGTERYRELNLSAEYLNRPIENLLCTMTHEMCHLYALENNIADVSKQGKYHNKTFKRLCEERDLMVEYVKYIGYSKTSPTQAFIEKLKANSLYIDSLENYRLTLGGNNGNGGNGENNGGDSGNPMGSKVKKSYVRKYLCVGCGKSVRATTEVHVGCLDCSMVMVKM